MKQIILLILIAGILPVIATNLEGSLNQLICCIMGSFNISLYNCCI